MEKQTQATVTNRDSAIIEGLRGRSLVLVGMMGAGKTAVGKRLSSRLKLPFYDADAEIEAAAQKTITEIFAMEGEDFFRDKEKRVIARLLATEHPIILATGGGAYMNAETRATIRSQAVSLWLRAEIDVLMRRVQRKSNRPLLKTENPERTLKQLMDARYPIYAQADIVVESLDATHESVLENVLEALAGYFREHHP